MLRIRLRRRVALHVPEMFASPLILDLAQLPVRKVGPGATRAAAKQTTSAATTVDSAQQLPLAGDNQRRPYINADSTRSGVIFNTHSASAVRLGGVYD